MTGQDLPRKATRTGLTPTIVTKSISCPSSQSSSRRTSRQADFPSKQTTTALLVTVKVSQTCFRWLSCLTSTLIPPGMPNRRSIRKTQSEAYTKAQTPKVTMMLNMSKTARLHSLYTGRRLGRSPTHIPLKRPSVTIESKVTQSTWMTMRPRH